MFWKLLRTLEILLEAFDPYVARTPNMEIMYMLAVSRTFRPPCHTVTKLMITLGKYADVASSVVAWGITAFQMAQADDVCAFRAR